MKDAPALVVPHREHGRWLCRRWRFICTPCGLPSVCAWPTPAGAADIARTHLAVIHGIAPIPTPTSRSIR